MKLKIPQRTEQPQKNTVQEKPEPKFTPEQLRRLEELVKRQMVIGTVVIDGSR